MTILLYFSRKFHCCSNRTAIGRWLWSRSGSLCRLRLFSWHWRCPVTGAFIAVKHCCDSRIIRPPILHSKVHTSFCARECVCCEEELIPIPFHQIVIGIYHSSYFLNFQSHWRSCWGCKLYTLTHRSLLIYRDISRNIALRSSRDSKSTSFVGRHPIGKKCRAIITITN